MTDNLLYQDECYTIRGAVYEVSREMGTGYLEAVYQECLIREFNTRSIPFQIQPELPISYKGLALTQTFRPDFICYGKIIVEIKSLPELSNENRAQVLNYLKIPGLMLALLVNFGHYPKATIERIIK
jgi:GxxExxY protein